MRRVIFIPFPAFGLYDVFSFPEYPALWWLADHLNDDPLF